MRADAAHIDMEFLRTPDSSVRAFALPTPGPPASDRQHIRSSFQSLFSPGQGGPAPRTPAFQPTQSYPGGTSYPGLTPFLGASTPAFPHHVGGHVTPSTPFTSALTLQRSPSNPVSQTQQQQPQNPARPPQSSPDPSPAISAPSPDMVQLTSPYLQAAAKEAVRREFMNMPSYITGRNANSSTPLPGASHHNVPHTHPSKSDVQGGLATVPRGSSALPALNHAQEQTVPGNDHAAKPSAAPATSSAVISDSTVSAPPASSAAVPTYSSSAAIPSVHMTQPLPPPQPQFPMVATYPYPHPYPGFMYIPYSGGFMPSAAAAPGYPAAPGAPQLTHQSQSGPVVVGAASQPQQTSTTDQQALVVDPTKPVAPAGVPPPVQQQQHGMLVMGPNGPVMIPAPAQIPGFVAAPGGVADGPMIVQQQQAAAAAAAAAAAGTSDLTPQPETAEQRKERVEKEKQDLIREFKKKTREAALVRFRQKRRERRFGKLIRYDCRKKLADARPRIKGRFVRVKDGEEIEDEGDEDEAFVEGDDESLAQVVPDLSASK